MGTKNVGSSVKNLWDDIANLGLEFESDSFDGGRIVRKPPGLGGHTIENYPDDDCDCMPLLISQIGASIRLVSLPYPCSVGGIIDNDIPQGLDTIVSSEAQCIEQIKEYFFGHTSPLGKVKAYIEERDA
ncbi:hypothetical protein [Hahella sp. NBU794]|uniref:hypothetical protein n=1 Tax=Hahella sp. NBU794 TaxID=3422590 RepID=UPI003D6E5639